MIEEDFATALRGMVRSWARYADAYFERYGERVGGNYVLGPEWAGIGGAILGLLVGPTGDVDCGGMDAFIRGRLTKNGVNYD